MLFTVARHSAMSSRPPALLLLLLLPPLVRGRLPRDELPLPLPLLLLPLLLLPPPPLLLPRCSRKGATLVSHPPPELPVELPVYVRLLCPERTAEVPEAALPSSQPDCSRCLECPALEALTCHRAQAQGREGVRG
jgi:hypothetical protein